MKCPNAQVAASRLLKIGLAGDGFVQRCLTFRRRHLNLAGSVRRWLTGALAVGVVSACGSSDTINQGSQPEAEANVVALSLTSNDPRSTKTGIGPLNLIDLRTGPWLTWSGEPTGIQYTTSSIDGTQTYIKGALLIPAPSGSQSMTVGVRRFERALLPGYRYTFSTESVEGASAIIFLFDETGAVVPVPGVSGLAMPAPDSPISFIAPAGIAGFYLQVQSSWQASEQQVVAPFVPQEFTAGGLIDRRRGWSDWQGSPVSGFGYNGLVGFTTIAAPEPGETLRFGVQRYPSGLIAGQQYELVNRPATAEPGVSSLLLFMFDANGALITDGASAWIAASSANPDTERVRFVAPDGVYSFAVQLQGAYMGGNEASYPALLPVNDE